MKKIIPVLFVLIAIVASCGGGKELPLDKDPFLKIENPYWMEIIPGQQDAPKSMVVIFPMAADPVDGYAVDSVYFKGYHEELRQSAVDGKEVYRARLLPEEGRTPVAAPFEIAEDEAVISYIDKSENKRYFIVRNIIRAEPIYMP